MMVNVLFNIAMLLTLSVFFLLPIHLKIQEKYIPTMSWLGSLLGGLWESW